GCRPASGGVYSPELRAGQAHREPTPVPQILRHCAALGGIAYSIVGDDQVPARPIALMGRITPKSTKGRGSPPAPFSGFSCDYTPFDKGHIMALELNGPDISENIVPQYGQWQETGRWKQMENAIKVLAGAANSIFVAGLTYPSYPNTYTAQKA